eukprot:COSAG06_NODE_8023_length_2285_cov_4.667223_2_plen_82_part_00
MYAFSGLCGAEVVDLGNDTEFVENLEELFGTMATHLETILGVSVEELKQFEAEYNVNVTTPVVTLADLQNDYGHYFSIGKY